ncbi:hypothetical protein TRIUR3_35339 [Triticum urartu]|uniref:Uncharacterized protein n=1 Tax=Triticum urartu TaxID=4572 RepID=M7ZH60_TRIUA|nr:hypothetical protein TRIUR3_35339 [Triticum urartu]
MGGGTARTGELVWAGGCPQGGPAWDPASIISAAVREPHWIGEDMVVEPASSATGKWRQRCHGESAVSLRTLRRCLGRRSGDKEVKEDRDVLQEEKKNLESVIVELLKGRHDSKEKLQKIKSILKERGGCMESKYILG